jgi:hypothetical protein
MMINALRSMELTGKLLLAVMSENAIVLAITTVARWLAGSIVGGSLQRDTMDIVAARVS